MLSGIASGWASSADVSDIRAWFVLRWPLPERRPATPEAARLGHSEESGQRRIIGRISSERGKGCGKTSSLFARLSAMTQALEFFTQPIFESDCVLRAAEETPDQIVR